MQKVNKNTISQLTEADGPVETTHVHVEALAHQPIDQLKEILKHFGIIEEVCRKVVDCLKNRRDVTF